MSSPIPVMRKKISMIAVMGAAGITRVGAIARVVGVRKTTVAVMSAKTTVVGEATADVNRPVTGDSLLWTLHGDGGSPAKEDVLTTKKEVRTVMTRVEGAGGPIAGGPKVSGPPAVTVHIRARSVIRVASSPAAADVPVTVVAATIPAAAAIIPVAAGATRAAAAVLGKIAI